MGTFTMQNFQFLKYFMLQKSCVSVRFEEESL